MFKHFAWSKNYYIRERPFDIWGGGCFIFEKQFLVGAKKNKMLSMKLQKNPVLPFVKFLQHLFLEIKGFLIQYFAFIHF